MLNDLHFQVPKKKGAQELWFSKKWIKASRYVNIHVRNEMEYMNMQ